MLQGMREAGIDPESRLDRYLRLLNDCIEERPMDMNIGVHLCRGNTKDGYAKGGYGRIATKLFRAVDVNCFYVSSSPEDAQHALKSADSSNMTQSAPEDLSPLNSCHPIS